MTTIAWDGKILAADRLVSCSKGVSLSTTKIWRNGKDGLLAIAGVPSLGYLWKKWISRAEESAPVGRRPPELDDKELFWEGLEIWRNGTIFHHSLTGIFPVESKYVSMGSGEMAASATMLLGFDAIRAVQMASMLDTHTGQEVDSLSFEELIL